MELREFIKDTLVQIAGGVKEAQEATSETGAVVSPAGGMLRPLGMGMGMKPPTAPLGIAGRGLLQHVSFDVALTLTDPAQAKGGVGVFFGRKIVGIEHPRKFCSCQMGKYWIKEGVIQNKKLCSS